MREEDWGAGWVVDSRWILHNTVPTVFHREGEPCAECDKPRDPKTAVVVEAVDHERGIITFGSGDRR